jgi:4-hydroxybenzoate polyprenyltransferase
MIQFSDNTKQILNNINEMIMFKHSVFSFPFIFIAMIVAADGWFGFTLLILGVFCAITARNFAMGVNRYLDRDIDILNPRTEDRPSVDGRVDLSTQLKFIVSNAIGFILVSYFINDLAFYLSIPFLFILGFYSYTKRFTPFAHLFLGIALGLAPIAGVIAVLGTIPMWSILLALGVVFWVAGFDLLYSLQDMEFDKEQGLYSIPSIYGEKTTMLLSKIFHVLTILFWFLFVIESNLGLLAYFAVFLSALFLMYEHKIVNDDFVKIDKAFFTVNGYLGIMFFVFIILDKGF